MPGRRWSEKEVEKLRELYLTNEVKEIGKILGRTFSAVVGKAVTLGLTKQKHKERWSKEEIETLIELYPTHGVADLSRRLNRSISSVRGKISSIGLKRGKAWSPEKEEKLKQLYPMHSNKEIAKILGLTPNQVGYKAYELDLRKDKGFRRVILDKNWKKRKDLWTEKEIALLKRLYKKGKTISEIAKVLQRSSTAVSSKAYELGIKYEDHPNVSIKRGLKGERKASEVLEKHEWKIIEWGTHRSAYDVIAKSPEGKVFAVNIKYGDSFVITGANLKALTETEHTATYLLMCTDGNVFFLPVTHLKT